MSKNIQNHAWWKLKFRKLNSPPSSEWLFDSIPKKPVKSLLMNLSRDTTRKSPIFSIIEKFLEKLDISNSIPDILDIVEFPIKGANHEKFLIKKVKLKNEAVCNYVLNRKRFFCKVDLGQWFGNVGLETIIYLNELMPGHTFKLCMARSQKQLVFAKTNLSKQVVCLLEENNLSHIMWGVTASEGSTP